MEKLDSGYVYTDQNELKKCASWFRRNQRQIPGMEAGNRINGDRILYAGTQPPDYLRMMQTLPEIFGQQPADRTPEEVEKLAICAVLKIATSGMTPMEAMVFLNNQEQQERIVRFRELRQTIQLSRSTIWRKVRAGEFPKPIALGKAAVGWLSSEIQAWIANQAGARRVGRR